MARRKVKAREALSRERIEIAAMELIEREGIDGFSTRKLAAELGCEAMSVYHYFPSKAHLMDALVDRFTASIEMPPTDQPWAAQIKKVAFNYRAIARRHPRFYRFAALHRLNTMTGLRFLEHMLGIFRSAGFDVEAAGRFLRIFGYYLGGALLEETAGYGKGYSAAEPVPDDVVGRDFPLVVAVNPYFKAEHHEATFRLGLEILIDEIAAMAPAAKKPRVLG